MKTVSRGYFKSSSFKMALLFTVLLIVSAAILVYFMIDFGKRDFLRETEAAIDIEISMISSLENPEDRLVRYIQRRGNVDQIIRFRYESRDGKLMGGTIDPMPPDIEKIAEGILGFKLGVGQDLKVYAAKIHTFGDGSRLMIARNIHELIVSYERLRYLSGLIMALMLSVIMVSFGISYFVVSRINRIADTAQNIIETGDLSQRLSIDSRWDDISNLSQVLNGFLSKLEDLMNDTREVSNNIAHDLRTPLSGLRSDIESLKGQIVNDCHIDNLLVEADRILAVFHALLRIVNIEKGKRSSFMIEVDLGQVMRDVAELYDPVAEEKGIHVDVHAVSSAKVMGDRDLLFQLFANIIDNAIKFSPQDAFIRLGVKEDKGQIIAVISDQGPGIPDTEKEKVFRHFYRGDASRSTPGNGLGLSLVWAIVDQHQAQITLENMVPGLSVYLYFKPYQSFRVE